MKNVMVIIIKDGFSAYDGVYVFSNERDAREYFQHRAGVSSDIFIGENIMYIKDSVGKTEGDVHWAKLI